MNERGTRAIALCSAIVQHVFVALGGGAAGGYATAKLMEWRVEHLEIRDEDFEKRMRHIEELAGTDATALAQRQEILQIVRSLQLQVNNLLGEQKR